MKKVEGMSEYEESLRRLVGKFTRERGRWEKAVKKAAEENNALMRAQAKRIKDFEAERKILKKELLETDGKLQEAGIKREKMRYELDKGNKDFSLLMKAKAGKIETMKANMTKTLNTAAQKMAEREMRLTAKFSAAQGEIKSIINDRTEKEINQRIKNVDEALANMDMAVAAKIREIKEDIEKGSAKFWKDLKQAKIKK